MHGEQLGWRGRRPVGVGAPLPSRAVSAHLPGPKSKIAEFTINVSTVLLVMCLLTLRTQRGGVTAMDGERHACRSVSTRGGGPRCGRLSKGGGARTGILRSRPHPRAQRQRFDCVGTESCGPSPHAALACRDRRLLPSSSCSTRPPWQESTCCCRGTSTVD